MANIDKYLQLSETGQLLVEICLLIQDRKTIKELEEIVKLSGNPMVLQLGTDISNNELNSCAVERFLIYRYSAIEPIDFDKEEIFFHAIGKAYFKDLCLGFYKFTKEKKYGWSWSWSENFQELGNLMKLYVFDDEFFKKNEQYKNLFERVKLDERWMMSEKILSKIFLKGLSIEKFERIPFPEIRMKLIEEVFAFFFFQMRPAKPFCDYLLTHIASVKQINTVNKLTHLLMLLGDKKGLDKLIKKAPNDYTLSLAKAQRFFLEGDFQNALIQFELNTIQHKKIEGQKRINFNIIYFLSGLCLLKLEAKANIWEEYWKQLYKEAISSSYLSLTMGMLSHQAKPEIYNEWSRTPDDYIIKNNTPQQMLFLAYAAFWLGRTSLCKALLNNKILIDSTFNYPWVKQEYDVLKMMLEGFTDNLPEQAVLWQIYAPKPEWELLLEHLETLLADSNVTTSTKDERLIWRFNPSDFNLDAILQKLNKNGTWSKGRKLNPEKLLEKEITRLASAQDLEIIKTLNKIYSSSNYNYYQTKDANLIAELLENLIGHPLLFLENSNDTAFQIYRGKLELQVLKSDDGYHFDNSLKDQVSDNPFIFKRETPTRYSYVPIRKEQLELINLIGRKKIVLPAKAEEQLKETLKKMVSVLPVHSDLIIDDSSVPEHPCDDRIYLHFLPIGEFFNVELFVKPFTEQPPYFTPGKGHERILADVKGQTFYVKRNLDSENSHAEELIAASAVLDLRNREGDIWTLDGIEPCLALLAELNELRKENKIVIEWPQGERLKISSYANFDSLFMNVRSNGNWFELEGELRVSDDLVMDMQLLLEKSRDSKNRFISLDDGSYLALTETLFRRLREIESWTQKSKNKLMISQFAGAAFSDLPDDLHFSSDEKWKEFVSKMKESSDKVFEMPQGLVAELRPYQLDGYQWLQRMAYWGAGACLADDMGLGKTVQAIAMLLSRAKEGPALVVAPASVCANWISELAKFAPGLNAHNLSQAQDRNKCIDEVSAGEILVTTYGLLHQASDALCAKKFGTIVLDEAQSIKNRFTKRSQAAMELQGDFRIITTGTPIENHLGELWNLFHFINPGLLGTAKMFQERFALPIEKWGDKEKRGQLQKLIKPFILRRLKKEVLKDLPEKTEITLRIERNEEESSFYEALRRKALENIQGGKFDNEGAKRLQVLAELMRLRRCCCHPSLIPGGQSITSSKLEALKDLVDELLQNGHKALIFSQFVDYLRIIEKEIKRMGVNYQYLDGSTPLKKRKTAIDAFQGGDGDIFLISLKAGGTGLNLTAADYVIHVDPWWNPAVEDQASDRAHRIGQQNPVTVYRLVAEGSIEEKIVKLHGSKREMAEALLQDTDGKVTMNADDLLDLLRGV